MFLSWLTQFHGFKHHVVEDSVHLDAFPVCVCVCLFLTSLGLIAVSDRKNKCNVLIPIGSMGLVYLPTFG